MTTSPIQSEKCKKCGSKLVSWNESELCMHCEKINELPKIYQNLKDKYKIKDDIYKHIDTSLYLCGAAGTGKTVFATFMVRLKWLNNINAKYINYPAWISEVRNDLKNIEYKTEKIKKYKGLIVLDDIGVGKSSDFVIERTYLIIDYRQTNNLQTVITSNLRLNELTTKFDPRISSRIEAMCKQIKFVGDKRKSNAVN